MRCPDCKKSSDELVHVIDVDVCPECAEKLIFKLTEAFGQRIAKRGEQYLEFRNNLLGEQS